MAFYLKPRGAVGHAPLMLSFTSYCLLQQTILQDNLAFGTLVNLAFEKPAFQSSTFGGYVADFAVDAKRISKTLGAKGCSHTLNKDKKPWWMVDLEAVYSIRSISIINRKLGASRLSNFAVEVSVEPPDTLPGFPQRTNSPLCLYRTAPVPVPGSIPFQCERPLLGRYVRVVKNGVLSLCDFQVLGEEARLWAFENVASQVTRDVQRSNAARENVLACARRLLKNETTRWATSYFRQDLPNGRCRLFQSPGDVGESSSSNWTTYRRG